MNVCVCARVSVWVPTRRSPTQSRANPTYREPAVASNATTFFGKKNVWLASCGEDHHFWILAGGGAL